ncbi:MAG: hypothetical protein AAGA30_04975 [Planctomycetota bacterium]
MTIDPKNWLRKKATLANEQILQSGFLSEIDVSDRVMLSVDQLTRPIVVSDNMTWVAGSIVSLVTACSVFVLLPSSFGLTDPWMSFWLF